MLKRIQILRKKKSCITNVEEPLDKDFIRESISPYVVLALPNI